MADLAEASALPRREFFKVAGAGALLLSGCAPDTEPVPGLVGRRRFAYLSGSASDVVVIGAGAFGGWTALNLRRMGARVTVVDAYGPGNARSTSGDETRGVRSSYGDRDTGENWMLWAREAIKRWERFDAEWGPELALDLFHKTGDLIMRPEWEPYPVKTREWWKKHNVPHEVLTADEVHHRWPVIALDDISAVLYEPDAGVVRARRACQAVASVVERLGGRVVTGRARPSRIVNGRLEEITLDTGQTLRADTFVFAVGPWLGKTFPELLKNRMRTPMGYVCYFGTPVNDERFTHPNLPSFNFAGVTGWASLPVDNRGFRVRGSVRAPAPPGTTAAAGSQSPAAQRPPRPEPPPQQLDPDLSDRWPDASRLEGPRRFLSMRFPLLKDAPILQTHACHYESSSSRNFIIDRHPQMSNVWIAGAGNAEGFKFGPVVGEYVAQRVLGDEGDAAVAKGFRLPEKEFEITPPVAADTTAKGRTTPTR